jgi:hypothetical protein
MYMVHTNRSPSNIKQALSTAAVILLASSYVPPTVLTISYLEPVLNLANASSLFQDLRYETVFRTHRDLHSASTFFTIAYEFLSCHALRFLFVRGAL